MKMAWIVGLLLGYVGAAQAADGVTVGAWSVDISQDGSFSYAASISQTGEVLEKTCNTNGGSCGWLVLVKSGCDAGSSYSALAAGSLGASPIAFQCLADPIALQGSTYYRMVVTDPRDIEHLVLGSGFIGIAYALQSGMFHAMRFPIDGASKAIQEMEQLAAPPARAPTNPSPGSTTGNGDF